MKKKLITAATMAALLLGSSTTFATTKIEWLQWFAAENSNGFYTKMVEEFEAKNPDIEVKLITQPFGKVRESIITNRAIGLSSDVLGLNMPWTSVFLKMGVLEPLDDYLAQDNSFETSDLVQAPIGKINGKTWMVPLNAFPFVMHYNKALLADAGFDAPPTSWDELKSMATKISTLGKGISGLGLPFSSQPPSNGPILTFLPLLYTAGGRIMDGTAPNFDNPTVVKTLNLLNDLKNSGAIAPGFASRTGGVDLEEFIAGRTGFLISPGVHASAIQRGNPKLEYGLASVPKFNKSAYRVHGWELGIAADSKNKDAAWKLIDFLLSKEVNARFAANSKALPGNLAALDKEAAKDSQVQSAMISILNDHEPVEELRQAPKSLASWSIMTEEIQKMLAGGQTPVQTAAVVQSRWLKLLK